MMTKFKVTNIIQKFRRNMTSFLSSRKLQTLNQYHCFALNDLSSNLREQKNHYLFRLLLARLQDSYLYRTFQSIAAHKQAPAYAYWLNLVLLLEVATVVYTLLRIAFDLSPQNSPLLYEQLYRCALFVLVLDAVLNLFSARSPLDPRSALKKHKQDRPFWIDAVTLTSALLSAYRGLYWTQFLFLARILRISKSWELLKDRNNLLEKNSISTKLLELCMMIVLAAHFWSCGFILIGRFYSDQDNWMAKQNVELSSRLIVYIDAFYYCIVSMTTIGYGDITPQNSTEKVYVIVMAIVSSGNFAYTVNLIGQIFQEKNQKEAQLKNDRQIILQYMRDRQVNSALQQRILDQLSFMDHKQVEVVLQA